MGRTQCRGLPLSTPNRIEQSTASRNVYTYGRPPADSLASSFLGCPSRGNGQDVIRTHGQLPCATPKGLRICGED
ncbi:hypothetical protein ACFRQM_18075 [Streptomyces sp. NPDC056831]|uniref:hypothetical protein n=1 Tax=Streptomyces sp. NPDC056831 TaxID=3345954 RepID=UPI0036B1EC9A